MCIHTRIKPLENLPSGYQRFLLGLCLSQFQLGTSPLATPGKIFWGEQTRPPGQIFFSNSLPRSKKRWSNSQGVGQNFPKLEKTPLSLQKILKKSRKLRDSTNFLFGELTKLLYFRMKQNHSKVFKYSSLQYFN